jgi:hypothetical protein
MVKPLASKQSNPKSVARRAFRSINDDISAHRWRYAGVCFMHGWLLAVLLTQPYITFVTYVLAFLEVVMVAVTVNMLFNAARKPGRLVHEWALQENQHQTITSLKGKTTEELEKMLDYHMENGNMEAADKISQQLLHMVDGMPINDPEPVPAMEIAKKVEDGSVIKISAGLPNWMQEGKAAAEDEQQQQQSDLPDWMKS